MEPSSGHASACTFRPVFTPGPAVRISSLAASGVGSAAVRRDDAPGAQDDLDPPPPHESADESADGPQHPTWRHTPLFMTLPGTAAGHAFWFAVFVMGVLAFWYLTRREKALAANRPDPMADPVAVDNTLILAVDQRAAVEFDLPPTGRSDPDACLTRLSGLCVHLDRHCLFVQLDSPVSGRKLDGWIGKNIRVHLIIHLFAGLNHEIRFVRFNSVALRATSGPELALLEMTRPFRLERFERRAYSRLEPVFPDVIAIGLWDQSRTPPVDGPLPSDDACPADSVHPAPTDPASLPAPLFLFHPRGPDQIRLANISASGLGLRLKKNLAASVPTRCVILLSLRQSSGRPLTMWLACVQRHCTRNPSRASVVLGFHIVQWSQVTRADSSIAWQHTADTANGGALPPLLHWILGRQAAPARNR